MQSTRLATAAFIAAALLTAPPATAQAQTQSQAQSQDQPQDQAPQGAPVPSEFVYQGVLEQSGQPVTEPFMASFVLYPVPSGSIGPVTSEIQRLVTPDDRGRFSVELNFGLVFDQAPLYLQISVLNDSGDPTVLSPRTKVTAAPLATYALSAPVPTLAEITGGRLASTDTLGNFELTAGEPGAGLTIANQAQQTTYAAPGVTTNTHFSIDSTSGNLAFSTDFGNIDMDAPTGRVELTAAQKITLQTSALSRLELSPTALHLNSTSIDIDAAIAATLGAVTLNLNGDATIKLSSPVVQLTGGTAVIENHQFNSDNATIAGILNVTGNAFKPGGGSWGVLSDARQKKNITPLTGSLGTLLSLRPVRFEYNDPTNPLYVPGVQTGFVAQEVRPILPDWVDAAPDGTLLLTPRGFEALVVGALQELQARHEDQIGALRDENQRLRARLDRLESMVGAGSN